MNRENFMPRKEANYLQCENFPIYGSMHCLTLDITTIVVSPLPHFMCHDHLMSKCAMVMRLMHAELVALIVSSLMFLVT